MRRFLSWNLFACAVVGALALPATAQTCNWSAAMPPLEELDGVVHAMEVFDDGNGPMLYLGGSFAGERLAKMYRENIGEGEILETLRPIFHRYAEERHPDEHFGDFMIRAGYVEEVRSGLKFHGPV